MEGHGLTSLRGALGNRERSRRRMKARSRGHAFSMCVPVGFTKRATPSTSFFIGTSSTVTTGASGPFTEMTAPRGDCPSTEATSFFASSQGVRGSTGASRCWPRE